MAAWMSHRKNLRPVCVPLKWNLLPKITKLVLGNKLVISQYFLVLEIIWLAKTNDNCSETANLVMIFKFHFVKFCWVCIDKKKKKQCITLECFFFVCTTCFTSWPGSWAERWWWSGPGPRRRPLAIQVQRYTGRCCSTLCSWSKYCYRHRRRFWRYCCSHQPVGSPSSWYLQM